ncbi:MAG: hypothetical protein HY286_05995 [Planctomycetes bacterium]|nr:hypothetical protein [Planctomycetota bacterium]
MKTIIQLASAAMLCSGIVMAQSGAPTPNAIGIWNSSTLYTINWIIGGTASGPGDMLWQPLPPELTTYFRNNSTCVRELDFRGVEIGAAQYGLTHPVASPNFQMRNAVPFLVPQTAGVIRWHPGNTIYVDFLSIPGSVNAPLIPSGHNIRISYLLATPVAIPTAPGGVGDAIMGVWNNFTTSYADQLTATANHSDSNTFSSPGSNAFSGYTDVNGQYAIIPNSAPPISEGNPFSEFCWTYFFEQSMVQFVVNSQIVSAGGQIAGGGATPIPYAFYQNDGYASLYPKAGDTLSYSGNSSYGNPGAVGTVWFAPFVQFSGDVGASGASDPVPEMWANGPMYIYCSPVASYIDDLCLLTGGCQSGTGAALNPANSRHALWLGVDLGNNLYNPLLLVNGLNFADVSSGYQWAGPASKTYNSVSNPTGLFARNLYNLGPYFYDSSGNPILGVMELRTLLVGPQCGYTPFALAPGSLQFYGFGTYNGGLAGKTFSIQAWMIDMATGQIVDVTNVATARLQ